MGAIDELRQLFRDAFEERVRVRDYDRGLLGDGQGNLYVAGDTERRVWFRKNGQPSQLLKVHCYLARPMDDAPVICGTVPEQPELYQVLSWDRLAYELGWGGMSSVAHHGEMHTWYEDDGMDDPVWVWTRAMMPFRVSPQAVPNMTVRIEGPEVYLWQTGWMAWDGDAAVNLAGSVPGAGLHRYTLVYIDGATSTAQTLDGSTYALALPIPVSGWPQPPSGSIPVGLIYLTTTTTEITEDEIVDGRVIVGSAGGSLTPNWPCWMLVVAHCNGDYDTVSGAIAYLNALTAAGDPDAPAADKPWTIWAMAGEYVDNTANVIVPQYVHLRGQGEATILDLGDYELGIAADASVESMIVTSTGDEGNILMQVSGADATLREVRLILTGAGNDGLRLNSYEGIELYHVILEATAVGGTAIYCDGANALLWDVKAHDTTHWGTAGLYLDNGAVVTTKFCEFRAAPAGDDVLTIAGTTWNHFETQFDLNNVTLAAGTHIALPTKRFNQTVLVVKEGGDFQALSEAIAYINAQGDAAANKLYGIKMLAGNYAEAGNVTIPQHVHVLGMGEGTEIEMAAAQQVIMASDTSLKDVVIEGSPNASAGLIYTNNATNVILRNVHGISSGAGSYVFYFTGISTVKCHDCLAEARASNITCFIFGTGTYECHECWVETFNTGCIGFRLVGLANALLENCVANDTTNLATGLDLANTACTAVTKKCTFRAATDDVSTGAASTWEHLACHFDPTNVTIAGTHTALPTKRFNQEVIVAEEGGDFEALSEAVAWIVGQGDAAANKLYGILMLAGNYPEAAPVTIPSFVGVVGQGEDTRIEMAGNQLNMSDDSYLADVTAVFTSGNGLVADDADCILWHVKSINDGSYCFRFMGDSVIEATHCIAETTSGCFYGFQVRDTANVTMHDCVADDAVNFTLAGLVLTTAACTCTTRYCVFHGDTDDVWTGATSTWEHIKCEYDANNSTIIGTETALTDGAVKIFSTDIRSHNSLEPNLGTTTDAEAWGDIYQAPGRDIRPDTDNVGLFRRVVNRLGIAAYDDHFRSSVIPGGFAWQGAPFSGTPAALGYSYAGDYMIAIADGAGQRHFLSTAIANNAGAWQGKSIWARIRTGITTEIGIRVDDGTDNNYAEVYVTGVLADATQRLDFEFRTGGGAVNVVTSNLIIPVDTFVVVRLFCYWSGANYQMLGYVISEESLAVSVTGFATGVVAWMPAAGRVGIIVKEAGNYASMDWFQEDFG